MRMCCRDVHKPYNACDSWFDRHRDVTVVATWPPHQNGNKCQNPRSVCSCHTMTSHKNVRKYQSCTTLKVYATITIWWLSLSNCFDVMSCNNRRSAIICATLIVSATVTILHLLRMWAGINPCDSHSVCNYCNMRALTGQLLLSDTFHDNKSKFHTVHTLNVCNSHSVMFLTRMQASNKGCATLTVYATVTMLQLLLSDCFNACSQ